MATPERRQVVPQLDPPLDFLRHLWSIENCLQRTSKRMAATLGVTGPQRLALRAVSRFPGISPSEVADLLRLHPSTITGILQRLLDKGLVARKPHTDDRRRVHLHVTAAAAPFTRTTRTTIEAAVARALGRVPPGSVRRAREVLGAIIDELESTAAPARRQRRRLL